MARLATMSGGFVGLLVYIPIIDKQNVIFIYRMVKKRFASPALTTPECSCLLITLEYLLLLELTVNYCPKWLEVQNKHKQK